MNAPLDMSRFIEAKSDQLNADDLIGAPRTITITRVVGCEGEQPIAIHYDGDNGKPFKPCKTIRRVLMGVWGRYADEYVGKSMTLYRDDSVTFGGLQVGGIRISHMSGLEKETTVVVMKSKGKKAGMKILPLRSAPAPQQQRAPIDEARDAITNAADLDALRRVWMSKAMAPFREQLQADLDQRKAELSFAEGPTDSQRGEYDPQRETCDRIVSDIRATHTAEEIAAVESREVDNYRALPDEMQVEIDRASADQRAKVGGGER